MKEIDERVGRVERRSKKELLILSERYIFCFHIPLPLVYSIHSTFHFSFASSEHISRSFFLSSSPLMVLFLPTSYRTKNSGMAEKEGESGFYPSVVDEHTPNECTLRANPHRFPTNLLIYFYPRLLAHEIHSLIPFPFSVLCWVLFFSVLFFDVCLLQTRLWTVRNKQNEDGWKKNILSTRRNFLGSQKKEGEENHHRRWGCCRLYYGRKGCFSIEKTFGVWGVLIIQTTLLDVMKLVVPRALLSYRFSMNEQLRELRSILPLSVLMCARGGERNVCIVYVWNVWSEARFMSTMVMFIKKETYDDEEKFYTHFTVPVEILTWAHRLQPKNISCLSIFPYGGKKALTVGRSGGAQEKEDRSKLVVGECRRGFFFGEIIPPYSKPWTQLNFTHLPSYTPPIFRKKHQGGLAKLCGMRRETRKEKKTNCELFAQHNI